MGLRPTTYRERLKLNNKEKQTRRFKNGQRILTDTSPEKTRHTHLAARDCAPRLLHFNKRKARPSASNKVTAHCILKLVVTAGLWSQTCNGSEVCLRANGSEAHEKSSSTALIIRET